VGESAFAFFPPGIWSLNMMEFVGKLEFVFGNGHGVIWDWPRWAEFPANCHEWTAEADKQSQQMFLSLIFRSYNL